MSPSRRLLPAIITFVVVACALAWLAALPLWLGDGLGSPLTGILLPIMMFTPLLATIVVMATFRIPERGWRMVFLGIWPLRPAPRTIWFTVAAIAGSILIPFATIAVAVLFGWAQLDLVTFSGFADSIEALGVGAPPLPIGALVALQLLSIPVGALINAIFAFGEEVGWRGWLVPALRPYGIWPTLLLSGIIWGLWHSPVILLGYNFARADLSGVAFMVGGCVAWGVLFGWLRLRTGSVWPAVFGHGALNAAGGTILLLAASGAAPDMALAGPLGVAAWIVIAVVVIVLITTGQFRKEGHLHPQADVSPTTPA